MTTALAVILMITGCGRGPATTTPDTGTPTPSPQAIHRPKELPLDGVDPCTILTEQQRKQFELDEDPRPGGVVSEGDTVCLISKTTTPSRSLQITTIPRNFEITEIMEGKGITVGGYPAIESVLGETGNPGGCTQYINVANGWTLDFQLVPNRNEFDRQRLCGMTAQIAETALSNLRARK